MATAYTMSSYHQWDPWKAKQNTLTITGSFAPASLVVNDTFKFFYIMPGTTIQHIGFIFPDMDTNVSPLIALSVGDSSSATLFISSGTTAQAGGSTTTAAGLPKSYSSADYLIMTVSTAPATAALGAITFLINMSVDSTTNIL